MTTPQNNGDAQSTDTNHGVVVRVSEFGTLVGISVCCGRILWLDRDQALAVLKLLPGAINKMPVKIDQ